MELCLAEAAAQAAHFWPVKWEKLSPVFQTHSETNLFVAFKIRTSKMLYCNQKARDRDEPHVGEQN
jgi:hypothetical protein